MPTSVILAVIAFAAGCVGLVLWMRSRKSGNAELPLYIEGFALIGFDKNQMTRTQARLKAEDLESIRDAVLIGLHRIYGIQGDCVINKLILDNGFYKAAEWSKVHARILWVNPTKPKHRSHFAEEIHTCFRIGLFGDAHRYEPVDEQDRIKREEAQSFCRNF